MLPSNDQFMEDYVATIHVCQILGALDECVNESFTSVFFQVLFELELLLRAWKRRTENPLTAHLQREATDQLVSACCSIFAVYIGSVSF